MYQISRPRLSNTLWLIILFFVIDERKSFISAGSSSSSSSYGCGKVEIGDITCGAVNAVTSIDVVLYPPAETTYEIIMTWQDGEDPVDTVTTYYTDISSAKTVTLSVMFSEPDTQSVSITVRGYNENYVTSDDQYSNNKWRSDEACYEATKPPNDSDVWAVVVQNKYCSVSADFSENQRSWYSTSEVSTTAAAAAASSSTDVSGTNFWSMTAFGLLCVLGIGTLIGIATLIIGTKNQRTIEIPNNDLFGTTSKTTTALSSSESTTPKSPTSKSLFNNTRQGNAYDMA